VLPEWINRNLAANAFAADGDYPLNFVSHSRGSLQSDLGPLSSSYSLTRKVTHGDTRWAAPFFETVRSFDTRGSLLIALFCVRADAP
jgi:hypothetical protein